jgi:pimeloyl-ACP methyl ester carboxylesterase
MMPTRLTMTLPDGRQLEYLQTGPDDGPALLFHAGTPNPAVDFSALTGPATELGLRTISYSRPGYGASTEQPGRTVADSVADVTALLDALGVESFHTLGWSGGGPHALACAALLDQRCIAATVLAGVAPYRAPGLDFLAGMDDMNVEEFTAAAEGFDTLTEFLQPAAAGIANISGSSMAEGMDSLLSEVDRGALTGAFADEMAEAMRHGLSNGIAGWRDDDLAFTASWGFSLRDITIPVAIWQGRQDRMVPFEHGQWLAAEIPDAQAHLFEDEGHLSLTSRLPEILADLLQSSR